MREFVINHTGRFVLLWLGAVILGTGLGSLALGQGVPLAAIVYMELVLQLALAFAIAFGVPDKLGGLVAAGLVMILPLGAFVTWSETVLSSTPSLAKALVAAGMLIAGAAVWRPAPLREHASA